ncbi:MAG: TM2 domain-containing protein [Benniella sp.]|nr:MAG: TM2 domain-containing protein [Benniella sp.]
MSHYGTTARRDEESEALNRRPSSRTHANDTFYGRTIIHIHTHRKRYLALWFLAAVVTVSTVVGLFYYHKQKHHKGDPFAPDSFATHPRHDDECKSDRSYAITILLSIFFGYIGIDRFYLGHIITGLLKLITAGGFGIWYIIDIILIVIGALPDHNGCRLAVPN